MKITKNQLRRIIKEERQKLLKEQVAVALDREQVADVDQIIQQGRAFFDRVIQLSQNSEDDPAAQDALDQIEAALSAEVEERSYGYVKFKLI